MDGNRFDNLARAFARRLSRRSALKGIGVAGFGAALASPRLAAQEGETACVISMAGEVIAGAAPISLSGEIAVTMDADGTTNGTFAPTSGASHAVVGHVRGRAIDLLLSLPDGNLAFSGVGEHPIVDCQGSLGGLFSGPEEGGLGSWQGMASRKGSTAGSGGATDGSGQGDPGAQPPPPSPTPTPTATPCSETTCQRNADCCSGMCSGETGQCVAVCSGFTFCGDPGFCVDLTDDSNHCGACFTACGPGQFCEGGQCVGCPAGTVNCRNTSGALNCANLMTDNFNCGACGNECPGFHICCNGVCAGPFTTDPLNCGSCGNVCSGGTVCVGGACCLPSGAACAAGGECCSGQCLSGGGGSAACV